MLRENSNLEIDIGSPKEIVGNGLRAKRIKTVPLCGPSDKVSGSDSSSSRSCLKYHGRGKINWPLRFVAPSSIFMKNSGMYPGEI